MTPTRKTTEELIADEEKNLEQVKARMSELKARQKTDERKRDADQVASEPRGDRRR